MTDIKTLDKTYIANTYARFPIEIVSGKGSIMTDSNGKKYIDMGSGIGVSSFGAADDEWVAAVTAQLHKIQHTSNLYYTAPDVELAQLLCEKTGMKKVFFGNSGAEANECAIKAARKYQAEHKGPEYYTIVTLWNSFHGRTLTTLAATGQDHYHELYQPLTPGFVHAKANDIDDMIAVCKAHKTAAIMMECVQGEGGVKNLDADFIKSVAKFAKENDILLIIDEVQTGNGRSGRFYAYQCFDIEPDIVSTAKGLGGGLPIGACLLSEKLQDVFGPGDHGSTYGGNPICCAGAVSVVKRIDDAFLAEVRKKSEYAMNAFRACPAIKEVTGLGLIMGILPANKTSKEVLNICLDKGVAVLTAKDRIRMLPPLNIPMEELKQAVQIIIEACEA